MQVDFAFLCDYADNSTKLNAIGIGFDTIYTPVVPVRHSLFYAVIAIRFSSVEVGQKRVGVRVIDGDGKNIVPPEDMTIEVPPPPEGYTYRVQRIALALHGVAFPKYGDYSVSWLVDGHEVEVVPLKIAPLPKKASTS